MRSFADGMIHEYTFTVSAAFLILPALKPVLVDLADVTLIGVVFRIIKNRNRWLTKDLVGFKTWQRIHSLALILLVLFAVADIALYIYTEVLVFTKLIDIPKLNKAASRYKYIHITYMTMYFAASVDILVCAGLLMFRKWRQDRRSRVSGHHTPTRLCHTPRCVADFPFGMLIALVVGLQIVTLLVTIVSPSLLLRSTALLAAAIRYSFLDYSASRTAGVVTTALWGLPSIIIFIGLLLIQFNRGWFSETPVSPAGAPPEEIWPASVPHSNSSSPQMQDQAGKPWVVHQVRSL